jgi:hypothetical protein
MSGGRERYAMSDKRRIKLFIDTGSANARHIDYIDLPDDWDQMSGKDQEEYLDEEAQDFVSNYIEFGAVVVDEDDEA